MDDGMINRDGGGGGGISHVECCCGAGAGVLALLSLLFLHLNSEFMGAPYVDYVCTVHACVQLQLV